MNIGIILSGGVGKRFGGNIPKQYFDLCGKPVIQYVIDEANKSISIDEYVIVMDNMYLNYVKFGDTKKYHIVKNGAERVDSVINALNYIKNNIVDCDKIIILQAASPFITSKIIDEYISLLDDYDVITTADKITGELFKKDCFEKINRNKYYFCQSPEAFHFNELLENIDSNSEYTELIYHYKNEPRIYFYTDFNKNVKLTKPDDLEYAKFLLS